MRSSLAAVGLIGPNGAGKTTTREGVVFSSDREGLAGELERIAGAASVCVDGATYTVQGRGTISSPPSFASLPPMR